MEHVAITANNRPIHEIPVGYENDRSDESERLTISFYENQVPPYVEAEMERLYECVYTTVARFRIYDACGNISTYVVRKGEKIITIFLFEVNRRKVKVLNEQIKMDEEDIWRFATSIFSRFKFVTSISFWAIQTAIRLSPFPHQQSYCLEEIVVSLPGTVEEYFSKFSKNMRNNIKKYSTNRIKRDFPSFSYQVYTKENINPQHIKDIIALSSARMATKNKAAYVSEEETGRIIQLVQIYGLAGVATIDGRVCAGLIFYGVGTYYFMHIIAHDPKYDSYRLGTACYYLGICECIKRGGIECRLMGSSHQYKFDFLGVRMGFDHLVVYRSHAYFLLDAYRIIKAAFKSNLFLTRLWLLHAERQSGFLSQSVAICLRNLRRLKRSRYNFLTRPK
jgi:hypothetical protein